MFNNFTNWCRTVLPSVYDDSLSYTEQLNKVIAYLNEFAASINTQINAITSDITALKVFKEWGYSKINELTANLTEYNTIVDGLREHVEEIDEKIVHIEDSFYVAETYTGDLNSIVGNNARNFTAAATNKPEGVATGMVITFTLPTPSAGNFLLYQIVIGSIDKTVYMRRGAKLGTSASYDTWDKTDSFKNFKEIFSGDLDELKVTGTYHINGNSSNIPVENLGGLCYVNDFTNVTGGTTTTQLYITATNEPEMYFRTTGNNGVFAAWNKVNNVDVSGKLDKPLNADSGMIPVVSNHNFVYTYLRYNNTFQSGEFDTTNMAYMRLNGVIIIPPNNTVTGYPDVSVQTNGGVMVSTIYNDYNQSGSLVGEYFNKIFIENNTGRVWLLTNPAFTVSNPIWLEITITEQFNALLNSSCKNALPPSIYGEQTWKGITGTPNPDGTIIINGRPLASTAHYAIATGLPVPLSFEKGTKYILSLETTTNLLHLTLTFYDSEGYQISKHTTTGTSNAAVVIVPENAAKYSAQITTVSTTETFENVLVKPMFRKFVYTDSTYTPYVPTNLELYNMIKDLTPTT